MNNLATKPGIDKAKVEELKGKIEKTEEKLKTFTIDKIEEAMKKLPQQIKGAKDELAKEKEQQQRPAPRV